MASTYKLTPQQIAASVATPLLGALRGPDGSIDLNNTYSWSAPTPAGGAPTRSVPTVGVSIPGRMTSIPAQTWSPAISGSADLTAFASPGSRLPQSSAGLPNPSPGAGLTLSQIAALGGWGVDPRTGQFAYTSPSAPNPALAAATAVAQPTYPTVAPYGAPVSSMEDALIAQGVRPGVPMAQQGANPGVGKAMIGNGKMAAGIPPQGPPPPGIAPTRWQGDPPPSQGGLLGLLNSGQAGRTGTAAGYRYVNGQRQPGYAPINVAGVGGGSYVPTSGAQAYALANAAGQINALERKAGAYGTSGGYTYKGGIKTGYAPVQVGGQTITPTNGAQAYELANAVGKQRAQDKATRAPQTSSSRNNDGSWATGAVSGSPFW